MKPGERHWRIASLISLLCLLNFGTADDKYKPADGIRTKNYEHPRFGNLTIRHCTFNQYYDEQEGRCVGTPGGGTAISIDHTTKCHFETLRAHPSRPNYFYTCRKTKTIFAKCPNNQGFDNRLKKCAMTDRKQSNDAKSLQDPNESYNHIELPPCTEPGKFPVPSDNCVYYTCTSNGFRLYREIYSCPSSNGFDPGTGTCTSGIICNRDMTFNTKPPTTKSLSKATLSDNNEPTTVRPDTITTNDDTSHDQVTSSPNSMDIMTMASNEDDQLEKKKRENSSTKKPYGSPGNVASSTEGTSEPAVMTTTPLQISTTTEVPYTTGITVAPEMKKEESSISPLSSSAVVPAGISEKTIEHISELETTTSSMETISAPSIVSPSTFSGTNDASMVQEGTTEVPTTIAYNTENDGEARKILNSQSTDDQEGTAEIIKSVSSTPSNDQETLSQAPPKDEDSTSSVGNDKVIESTTNAAFYAESPDALPKTPTTAKSDTSDVETVETTEDSTDPPESDSSTPANTFKTEKHDRKKRSAETLEDITWTETNTLPSAMLEESLIPEATEVRYSINDPSDSLTLTTARNSAMNILEGTTTISSLLTYGKIAKEDESTRTTDPMSADRWTKLYGESGYSPIYRTAYSN